LWGAGKFVGKQAGNLRAVGRKDDADKVIAEFLIKVFQEFKNEPENPWHLSFLTDIALQLGGLEAGKKTLESVIEGNDYLSLDLTVVYTDLGRIYHQLGTDPRRELWCYEMAAEAKAPLGCKFPATSQEKAIAHHFAYFVAIRLASHSHNRKDSHWKVAEWHTRRRRELVPEVNWDDSSQTGKFIQEVRRNGLSK
jgi:hypothetical protein